MKNVWTLAGLSLLAVAILAGLQGQKNKTKSPSFKNRTVLSKDISTDHEQGLIDSSHSQKETREFLKNLMSESAKLGQLDTDPEHTQRELERWAEKLDGSQIETLKNTCLDPKIQGDERSLAVYLLSLARTDDVIRPLTEIAASPIPANNNDRIISFEETIRAQAIDGITAQSNKDAGIKSLNYVIAHVDSSFLADRSQRALRFMLGASPSPSDQEHSSLQQLLEKTR